MPVCPAFFLQVLSASLLRKHPANTTSNGGTGGPSPSTTTLDDSTMGGGALQQLAVDLAVSNLEPMLAGHGRYGGSVGTRKLKSVVYYSASFRTSC